ncbi:hypothetical protein ABZY09_48055 [Streptomyces sp. NPDC002928]|uniref:hypothetical protein n=1 Tax=Streptomyces sp. NPDC002928 TaxID=3154440 RepID=UPI00339DAED2
MPGQQIDDMRRGGVQRLRKAGDRKVAAGYGLVEPGNGDAVRGRPRRAEAAHTGGVEARGPLDGFVDAVLVEDRARGVGEQFGLGGQDAPAKAQVLLAL